MLFILDAVKCPYLVFFFIPPVIHLPSLPNIFTEAVMSMDILHYCYSFWRHSQLSHSEGSLAPPSVTLGDCSVVNSMTVGNVTENSAENYQRK